MARLPHIYYGQYFKTPRIMVYINMSIIFFGLISGFFCSLFVMIKEDMTIRKKSSSSWSDDIWDSMTK
jgi:hypothetical protein